MIEYLLLIGPILFVVVSAILGKITPHYDWTNDYISELSLGKYGWLQKVNFLVCGVSLFALCTLLATRSTSLSIKLAWHLGSLMGIPTALAGLWDTDVKQEMKTVAGKLHSWTYHIGILGTGLTYILMGWGYRNHLLILILSWTVALFDLLWWNYSSKLGIKPGIGQRIVIYSALIWVVIMALWTLSF